MNNKGLYIITLALAMLWGFLAGVWTGRGGATADLPEVRLRIDTAWVHDTIVTPGPVIVRSEVRRVPADVDTADILRQHFTQKTLADTIRLRDMATVYIMDTVFRNNIAGRNVTYDMAMLEPKLEGTAKRQARLALNVGVQLGQQQAAVMAGVRYKRIEAGLGYDLRLHAPSITLKYDILQWP